MGTRKFFRLNRSNFSNLQEPREEFFQMFYVGVIPSLRSRSRDTYKTHKNNKKEILGLRRVRALSIIASVIRVLSFIAALRFRHVNISRLKFPSNGTKISLSSSINSETMKCMYLCEIVWQNGDISILEARKVSRGKSVDSKIQRREFLLPGNTDF